MWHVAHFFVLTGQAAALRRSVFVSFGCGQMTRKTLRIVVRRFLLQLLMRIVTAQTPDPRIVRVVPAAIEHAIRLKTNIVDT